MALFRSLRNELHKFGKHKHLSIDNVMPATDFPISGVKAELPNPGRHGAPSRQQDYDPIVAAYQAMEAAYEQPQSWFDGPVTPPQPASTSEARFTADDGINAVVIDHLQIQHEIQDAIDQAKAIDDMPEFAREFVDESEPEPDCAEPLEDMDSLLMPTEFAELPDETPEPQPPVSAEGFPSLEQIVQAEMPDPMPTQPDYNATPMTPDLLEQALQQTNAASPQPEDPEEQLRRQYDAQLEQLLNPYNPLLFNPFGMPGPG